MSTIAYAQFTTKREKEKLTKGTQESPPSVKTYADALLALVPAEVLTLHGLILSVTTKVENSVTTITDAETLSWAFVGLLIISMGLYVAPRLLAKKWDKFDWLRMIIPPLAFTAWTMLQRATAFDAVFPGMTDAARTVSALFLAVILGAGATLLAYKVD